MKDKKKVIIAIIITIVLGTLTILGSFALWTTVVGNNINVNFNTVALSDYIEYTAGKAVFSGNVEATSAYPEGVEGTYTTFKINKKNNPAYPFYAGLKMQINNISEDLTQSRVLKWTVTSKETGSNNSETVVAESDFVGTDINDTIILVPNILVTDTSTDYNVYIWVDSNNSNASLVEGETVEVELWMDVYQYRAPKVLDAYCYNDGTNVSCNILDSEKLFNRYGLNTTTEEPTSYTSISSGEYWTEIDTTITNENLIYFKTSDDRIKIEFLVPLFQRVEYIESTGTQYIDTGYMINENFKYQIKVAITDTRTATNIWPALIAAYTASNGSDGKYYKIGYTPSTKKILTTYSYDISEIHTITYQIGKDTFDGIEYSNSKVWNGAPYSTVYIFNSKTSNSGIPSTFAAIARIYYAKIYNENTLVRDFIPVYRITDNVAGLYDTVNDVFYTNAGTGTFTVGPDV